ncbi:Holliday junction DNA helicase subunit RuvA [Mycoplasmopsis mustelae]|uniref:Holliday junction branch migration complex subunit RuvA n=1 Tax=Mycoplasmopsis mustelae TaxID=171289 RepID=A0A4R7UEA1_9BACT|nr:Holliday junction branch migration protein RuvA [Mycoplasmopsis mustelae]TDV23263.1 Holliday junction DNA helicase subunit RuvA [Mycoplasmopsis mustelae]
MILYKIGEIVHKNKNNLIFESRGDGHIVTVPNINRFEIGQKLKIYIYEHATDYLHNFYGFKEFKERVLFMDLINVDKIGPKIAILMLDKGWELIARYIAENNYLELAKCQFVSEKTARLICVELTEKWKKMIDKVIVSNSENTSILTELSSTLQSLGFKKKQIEYALINLKERKDLDKMIEESIVLITSVKDGEIRA